MREKNKTFVMDNFNSALKYNRLDFNLNCQYQQKI